MLSRNDTRLGCLMAIASIFVTIFSVLRLIALRWGRRKDYAPRGCKKNERWPQNHLPSSKKNAIKLHHSASVYGHPLSIFDRVATDTSRTANTHIHKYKPTSTAIQPHLKPNPNSLLIGVSSAVSRHLTER